MKTKSIDFLYFWVLKLVEAVTIFSGCMFWMRGNADTVVQYIFSFLLAACILKITWK